MRQLAADILKQAQQQGASSAAVGVNSGSGYSVMVRNGRTEHVENHRGKSLGITVYFGKRVGNASTDDLSQDAVWRTLEKACYIARYTSEDPYAGLAEPELMAYNYQDLDLYHPSSVSIASTIEIAQECEAIGLGYDKRIVNSDGVAVANSQSFGLYANTHGFVGCFRTTSYNMTCNLIAAVKRTLTTSVKRANKQLDARTTPLRQEQMQRDGDYTVARRRELLISPQELGISAACFTLRRLGARRLTTRECPVIFEAPVAKSLIGTLLSAVSGSNLYNKMSFLCDTLGKEVIAPHLSIDEQPHVMQALGSAAFDGEGVLTKQQPIVNEGILARYILSSYSARKLKMRTTGNAGGCYNIFITTRNKAMDFKELLLTMDTGLVLIELLGHGVNMITGDYSCGAFGFWVEKGIIQYPVEGITIAGNLKDMLRNIIAMSNDTDKRGTIFTGSLLVSSMQVGGE